MNGWRIMPLVEKETGLPSERKQIAGVFNRRLQKRMRLQTDPTVIYGLGRSFDGNIRRRDLRKDTPYNTYLHKGLPPTPIAMPGRDAILAALNPMPSLPSLTPLLMTSACLFCHSAPRSASLPYSLID